MRLDPAERVSPHFTWGELTATNRRALQEQNRDVPDHLVDAGRALATTLLEPIRERFGPIIIHSGYRCPALNKAIGGAPTSQHQRFEAADFHAAAAPLRQVFDWLWTSGLPVGQCILEGRSAGKPTWIHISLGAPWRDPRRCGEFLTFDGTRYHKVGP
jgi:zinc D-Ala-D-Ala carboxypeptidase